MKYTITFILAAYFSLFAIAQNDKQEVEEHVKLSIQSTIDKDWDTVLDLTYPKVFEMASKEQMRSVIKMMFEGNEDFKIEIDPVMPDYTISEIVKGNDQLQFAVVDFGLKMKLIMKEAITDEAKKSMEKNLTASNVEYEILDDHTVSMNKSDAMMVVIKDDYTDGKWSSFTYDSNNPFGNMIFPQEVVDYIKARDTDK